MPGAVEASSEVVTPTGDPVMATKFHLPAAPPWNVVRERLHDAVSLGAAGPLTVVNAPAGSGKTVLASSWAARLTPGGLDQPGTRRQPARSVLVLSDHRAGPRRR